MLEKIEERYGNSALIPLLFALTANGIALVLSNNYLDGDPHTRTYMAIEWLRDPFFIAAPNDITWVFGPLHCYLNALALTVWNDPTLSPRVLSWLLTSLAVVPLYGGLRIEFGRRVAFYSTILFCFYSLYIHSAAIAVSEGINLLFIFATLWGYLRFRNDSGWKNLILCAIAALAATMMRYDSWPLATLMAVLIIVLHFTGDGERPRTRWGQLITFLVISHGFIIMWLTVSWHNSGDLLQFMHYSGNLDAPVIAEKVSAMGWLKYSLYNLAFLPGVTLIAASISTFLLSLWGLWLAARRYHQSPYFVVLITYVMLYLVVFVFSFERFPLARFTILQGSFLICFAGLAVADLQGRLRPRANSLVQGIAIAVPIVSLLFLGQFSQPSESDLHEKLRAVSPITQPPSYFQVTTIEILTELRAGKSIAMDCRNYNDRLLYLSLHEHFDQVHRRWSSTNALGEFVDQQKPDLVLFTEQPRRNHSLFAVPNSEGIVDIAGKPYKRVGGSGIFILYGRAD